MVSTSFSAAFLTELLACSSRPSLFRRWLPLSAPAASLTRPFALSMFLSVISPPDYGYERPSGRSRWLAADWPHGRSGFGDGGSSRPLSGGDRRARGGADRLRDPIGRAPA